MIEQREALEFFAELAQEANENKIVETHDWFEIYPHYRVIKSSRAVKDKANNA